MASPSRELLEQAEQYFALGVRAQQDPKLASKHFADSAEKYALLHAQGAHNADLYLNWGNAEALAGRVPQAILAYRRGLRLAPGRRDLLENLAFAQQRLPHAPSIQAGTAHGDSWLSFVPWLPQHVRLMLCLATLSAYTLASIYFLWWLKLRHTRLSVRAVLLLLLTVSFLWWLKLRHTGLPVRGMLLLLLTAVCGFFWQREEARLQDELAHPLVVVAQETGFQLGNGPSYPAHARAPILFPGMEARRLFERGGWLQIQLPGGAIGWVPGDAVLVDE